MNILPHMYIIIMLPPNMIRILKTETMQNVFEVFVLENPMGVVGEVGKTLLTRSEDAQDAIYCGVFHPSGPIW